MSSGVFTCIVIVLLAGESFYMLHRRPTSRLQSVAVADYDGLVALDTGQLCRTIPMAGPKTVSNLQPKPPSGGAPSGDPILDELQKLGPNIKRDDDATVEFVRALPACADIK
jgi:hypothetical protein